MIRLTNIEKSYRHGVSQTFVLRRVTVEIAQGDFVSIMGPSGAGKSTLLHILGMHDTAWSGEYWLHDQPVHALSQQGPAAACRSSTSASCSRATTCSTT